MLIMNKLNRLIKNADFIAIDYQLLAINAIAKMLIMSMFHCVPPVPCAEMERWNTNLRGE